MIGTIKKFLAETFSSMEHRDFRYFICGQSISLIGTWMQRTAQQWLVYTLTDSALLLGLLGVCQFAPMLFLSLPAGVYADRYPKKYILILTQVIQMVQALLLAALVWFGTVQYWHVFIMAAIFGLASTFEMPTRHSYFIELVGRNNLKNAIGLNSTIVNLAKIFGPALAGIIMARLGIAFCFLINGISYIAVLFSLIKIKQNSVSIRTTQQNLKKEIIDGLHYIKTQKQILYPVLMMACFGTFAMNTDVIVPVYTRLVLNQDAQGYSFLLSCIGIGALIGSLLFSARSQRETPHNSMLFFALGVSVCLLCAGLTSTYFKVLLVLSLFGALSMIFLTTVNSNIQLNTTDAYRGRVMSVYSMVFIGTTPIGNFISGIVTQYFGPKNCFYFCSLASIIFIVVIYRAIGLKKKSIKDDDNIYVKNEV
ncbi:MAG: MFS transporter [Syntrophomonas sp.]